MRTMTTLTKTWLGRCATAVGLAALGLFVVVFFVPVEFAKAWIYTVAFFALALAVILLAATRLYERHETPTAKPRTRAGWWSIGLAAGGLLSAVAAPAVVTALRRYGPRSKDRFSRCPIS
jgi:cell division protein FtsW (lipid II flippase)